MVDFLNIRFTLGIWNEQWFAIQFLQNCKLWIDQMGELNRNTYLGDTYAVFLINLIKWGSKAITIVLLYVLREQNV